MKIKFEIDLDYDEARMQLELLQYCGSVSLITSFQEDLISALDNALQNEDEKSYERHLESLMESGGADDSRYRQDLKDAGRGHLLR